MSLPPAMPPDRDEARRRAAADPVLASAVRAADAAGVGECLDVETLGLYVDRVLRGAALVSARAHIDKCERCRSIVSFVEKADAGATGGAAHGAWAWLTGWRWLVPAASVAAVAAAAVWVNRSPANEGPAPTPEATVALTRPVEEPAPPVAARSALRDGLVGSATSAPALPGQEPARADEAAQSGTRQAMSSSDAREKARADGTSAAPNAGPPVVRSADEARAEEAERRQTANLEMKVPPTEPVAGPAAGARPAPPVVDTAAPAAPEADVLASKRADMVSGVWRARDGALERLRAGAWQRVASPDGVAVVAISSPSRDVCWAIGATDILRTWNGDDWTRVALPETSEPLRAVSATNASTAVVTTASGVRFRTANGGTTWTRL